MKDIIANKIGNAVRVIVPAMMSAVLLYGCGKDRQELSASGLEQHLSLTAEVKGYVEKEIATKGELINDTSNPSETLDKDIVFHVAAWDTPTEGSTTRFIPRLGESEEDSDTRFDAVTYFDTELADNVFRNMWSTCYWNESVDPARWWIKEYVWNTLADKTTPKTKLFYAYANLPEGSTVKAAPTGMTLIHEVPADASSQKDILMGSYTGNGSGSGTAAIAFNHPLAAVKLKMGTLTGTLSFVISGISIEGVYDKGTAVMTASDDLFVWAPDGTTTTVTQSVSFNPSKDTGFIGEPFLLIPQSFEEASKARVAINVTIDGEETTIYIPLAGKTLAYGNATVFTVSYNGHEGVQLWDKGPYWATTNVGAKNPEDYGWFFSWGNVDGYIPVIGTKRTEDSYNCTWQPAEGGTPVTGVFTDNHYFNDRTPGSTLKDNIPANSTYDAAYKYIGMIPGKWRMPTQAEFEDLLSNTVYEEKVLNGVSGYLFKGKETYSNRFIFIPSAGYGNGDIYSQEGEAGMYWCSTIISQNYAYSFVWGLGDGNPDVASDVRWYGRTIRAVENVQ